MMRLIDADTLESSIPELGIWEEDDFTTDSMRDLIWRSPTFVPRDKGKWVYSDSQCGIGCPFCRTPVDDFCYSIDYIDLAYKPNFCPHCGAELE